MNYLHKLMVLSWIECASHDYITTGEGPWNKGGGSLDEEKLNISTSRETGAGFCPTSLAYIVFCFLKFHLADSQLQGKK